MAARRPVPAMGTARAFGRPGAGITREGLQIRPLADGAWSEADRGGLPPAGATWLPDSRSFVFSAGSPGPGGTPYQQDIEAPLPALTEADVTWGPGGLPTADDARHAWAGEVPVFSAGWGPSAPGSRRANSDQWRRGQAYVYRPHLPSRSSVWIVSGRRRRVREIVPSDVTGARQRRRRHHPGRAVARRSFHGCPRLYPIEGLDAGAAPPPVAVMNLPAFKAPHMTATEHQKKYLGRRPW